MWSASVEAHESTPTLVRVARPLACSVALHLGLLTILVVAGSAALALPPAARVAWLDLQPAEIAPPPGPVPVGVPRRSRSAPRPRVEPRALHVPVPDEPVAPPAQPPPTPPREVTAPEPTPPAQSAPSPPQSSIVMGPSNALEPDRSGASSSTATSAGPSTDSRPAREPRERGVNGPAVASRPPDGSADGPIVRAARPRGGYQVRPVYPESARRAGIQGTTLLRIYIERDGRVGDVSVQRSAGHQALDEAAADAVRRWRFEPALNSAGPVSMWALVPVEFRISDRD